MVRCRVLRVFKEPMRTALYSNMEEPFIGHIIHVSLESAEFYIGDIPPT